MLARYLASLLALVFAGTVLAHPGHDHSHWTSPAIHAVFYIGIIAMVAAGVWQYRKNRSSSKSSQKQQGEE